MLIKLSGIGESAPTKSSSRSSSAGFGASATATFNRMLIGSRETDLERSCPMGLLGLDVSREGDFLGWETDLDFDFFCFFVSIDDWMCLLWLFSSLEESESVEYLRVFFILCLCDFLLEPLEFWRFFLEVRLFCFRLDLFLRLRPESDEELVEESVELSREDDEEEEEEDEEGVARRFLLFFPFFDVCFLV